jgi:hypothetical protein
MKRDRTSLGVILVTALASVVVACAAQGDEGATDIEVGAADQPAPLDPQAAPDLAPADSEQAGAQDLKIVRDDARADLDAADELNIGAGCRLEFFCAYNQPNNAGSLSLQTKVDWSGTAVARSVYNHGKPFPGFDHVQVDWTRSDGARRTACVHYAPGPGRFWFDFNPFFAPVTITRVHWRGECRPGEDLPN